MNSENFLNGYYIRYNFNNYYLFIKIGDNISLKF